MKKLLILYLVEVKNKVSDFSNTLCFAPVSLFVGFNRT